MTRSITVLVSAAALAATLSGPVFAQGAPQTVSVMKVDPQSLATGFRASKVVGATVVNQGNVTVGTIDRLSAAESGSGRDTVVGLVQPQIADVLRIGLQLAAFSTRLTISVSTRLAGVGRPISSPLRDDHAVEELDLRPPALHHVLTHRGPVLAAALAASASRCSS